MGREDWYRNRQWNPAIEAAFRSRLSRSRYHRPNHLRIQAYYLIHTREHALVLAGLALADEFIATYPSDTYTFEGFELRAQALVLLGRDEEALPAYREALRRQHRNIVSDLPYDYLLYVARRKLRDHYEEAREFVEQRLAATSYHDASERFKFACAAALINEDLGHDADALFFANKALEAMMEKHSGLRRHPTMGLVHNVDVDLFLAVERLARER